MSNEHLQIEYKFECLPSEPNITWFISGPVETLGNVPVLVHSPFGVTALRATRRSSMFP